MSSDLGARIDAALIREVHPALAAFAGLLGNEAGALAVLFYGSNLRTGSLEGVVDFYVLLPGEPEVGIWPRVSYREWEHEGDTLRTKIATMTMAKFAEACRGETIDTTIWARFVQPSALVWSAGKEAREEVAGALEDAVKTASRLAVAVGPEAGVEEDYWRALFRSTYEAELRVEKPGRENSILEANKAHFDGLLAAGLLAQNIAFERDGNRLKPLITKVWRREILDWWSKRRRLGKALNIARLVRATRTFEGAGRYAAWKVHRHTGIEVEVTPWREKHPVLAAPGVLWKVWRAKRGG